MAYINQPPDLRQIFADLDSRLRKLETAVRFTSPPVTSDPTQTRQGDIWYNTATDLLKLYNGTNTRIIGLLQVAQTWSALQTFSAGVTVSSGNLIVSTGSITATTGSIGAATTLTAGTGITSTIGDITASQGSFVATLGGVTASAGTVSAANLTSTGTTTLGTVNFSTTSTATTVGAAGGASALPATPLGYLIVKVAGTDRKIPYYNT
jgi:hypothetical protein